LNFFHEKLRATPSVCGRFLSRWSKRSKSSGVGLLGKTDNAALAWLIDLALPILPASAIQSGEYMVRMQRLFWADEGN
jgi:hypothetical protein